MIDGREAHQKKDIPAFFTPDFTVLHSVWALFHEKGLLPFAGGWADQPLHLWHLIQALESEYTFVQKMRGKRDGDN